MAVRLQVEEKSVLVDRLLRQRKYKSLVQLYKKCRDDTYKEYKQLNYLDFRLKVGDQIMMQENTDNEENFAAIIKKILCIKDPQNTNIPLVKVQWYHIFCIQKQRYGSKEDVIVPDKYLTCISNKELFLSSLQDYRTINCIKRPIRVLTSLEYEGLQWEDEYIFFSRSSYNHQNYEVNPPFHKWTKICVCQLPQNPELKYIACDKCLKWFHLECVGIDERKVNEKQRFVCPKC